MPNDAAVPRIFLKAGTRVRGSESKNYFGPGNNQYTGEGWGQQAPMIRERKKEGAGTIRVQSKGSQSALKERHGEVLTR